MSRSAGLVTLAAIAVTVVTVLAVAWIDGALVYYRTPVEVATGTTVDRVRVGGVVADNSVRRSGQAVTFTLTDGVADIPVVHRGALPAIFREGQGAVVEGRYTAHGVLRSDTVLVRHSNEYGAEPDTISGRAVR